MENSSDARISCLVNGERPAEDIVTNYTTLQQAGLNPWSEYTDVRFDWNMTAVIFWVAGNLTRAITKHDRSLPLAGQPMYIRTWSTGDRYYMAGPPGANGTQSHVLYVRSFFNSSAMTPAKHRAFDERCGGSSFCSVDDTRLRGSTAYGPESLVPWTFDLHRGRIRDNAGIVAACCSSFGVFALINAFLRRTPWHALAELPRKVLRKKNQPAVTSESTSDLGLAIHKVSYFGATTPRTQTSTPTTGAQTPRSGYQTPLPAYEPPPPWPLADGTFPNMSMVSIPRVPSPYQQAQVENEKQGPHTSFEISIKNSSYGPNRIEETPRPAPRTHALDFASPIPSTPKEPTEPASEAPLTATEKGKQAAARVAPAEDKAKMAAAVPKMEPTTPATKRIDYLAGLVAIACMGVTLRHFCQTFWPYVVEGYGPKAHYPEAEKWFQIFVGSYLLTQFWIGPFLLTATRFLTTNYLKNGNLEDIAKKELRRAPRLFVPIVIVSLLEYFLLSMDLAASLEWLASVSWSTWPYVSPQDHFGVYLNNIIELGYLIPNAIPEIVTHYCIGVLWTVPVQLQYTYVVLTAAVLVRDIKNPWKRFGFYAIMILTGWYARVSALETFSIIFAV